MGERVLLVNPIRRKRAAKKPAKKRAVGYTVGSAPVRRRKLNPIKRGPKMAKRRTAAQRRATAKLVAFNRSRRRLSNPARKRRRLRRNPVSKAAAYRALPTIARPNPARRRRRRIGSTAVRRVRRRVRRNPLPSMGGLMKTLIQPAAAAAVGALALDIAFGYLPIPANLKTGPLNLLTKTAGAVALSMIAGKVVNKAAGQQMGIGALTVVLHDAAKAFIAQSMPALKMDGIGYYSAGYPVGGYEGMGVYLGTGGARSSGLPNMNGMGEYVNGLGRIDNEAQYYGS